MWCGGMFDVWGPNDTRIFGITGLAKGFDFVIAILRLQPDVALHLVEADDWVL